MAGVRKKPSKGGKFQGWFVDAGGKQRFFTGTRSKTETQRIADRLEDEPDDLEGWQRLARTYEVLGEIEKAMDAQARIKALTDAEDPKKILSDDKLVELLKGEGFDLARRTVAKYREAIGIGSSVQRRRAKKLAGMG